MFAERWSESTGSLLDSLPTLGYSDRRVLFPGLLACCFGYTVEIL
jgi:hypothetical protein